MALTSGTRLGPYEILSPVGRGGMGPRNEVNGVLSPNVGGSRTKISVQTRFTSCPFRKPPKASGSLPVKMRVVVRCLGLMATSCSISVTGKLMAVTIEDGLNPNPGRPRVVAEGDLSLAAAGIGGLESHLRHHP